MPTQNHQPVYGNQTKPETSPADMETARLNRLPGGGITPEGISSKLREYDDIIRLECLFRESFPNCYVCHFTGRANCRGGYSLRATVRFPYDDIEKLRHKIVK